MADDNTTKYLEYQHRTRLCGFSIHTCVTVYHLWKQRTFPAGFPQPLPLCSCDICCADFFLEAKAAFKVDATRKGRAHTCRNYFHALNKRSRNIRHGTARHLKDRAAWPIPCRVYLEGPSAQAPRMVKYAHRHKPVKVATLGRTKCNTVL